MDSCSTRAAVSIDLGAAQEVVGQDSVGIERPRERDELLGPRVHRPEAARLPRAEPLPARRPRGPASVSGRAPELVPGIRRAPYRLSLWVSALMQRLAASSTCGSTTGASNRGGGARVRWLFLTDELRRELRQCAVGLQVAVERGDGSSRRPGHGPRAHTTSVDRLRYTSKKSETRPAATVET